ncbi:MAG: hypothetical protein PHI81_04530 [Synergistaceae bacterium]|nr:hypothetical protein [Synergistaceae bacterium]MDD3689289.1 hypothetical protein [Synergistaceae bacterium]
MIRVEPEDDKPCDFVPRLESDIISPSGALLAVIRYSRSENSE